jgi:DNA-binding LytR/AlgR family response regulator
LALPRNFHPRIIVISGLSYAIESLHIFRPGEIPHRKACGFLDILVAVPGIFIRLCTWFPGNEFPGQAAVTSNYAPAPAEEKKNDSFVYFRADRKMVKVLLNDILYIESMKDYIKVITADATIITKQSISSVEAMLPEKLFVRTHRSFIVSLQNIKTFTNELIEVGKAQIPVGKLYRNTVLKMLE